MRRYYVDFGKPTEDLQDAFRSVDEAFEAGSTVFVKGEQEGVPVAFDLKVHSLAKRNFGARKVMDFSGVTVPEGISYIAHYTEELNSNKVDLKLYTSSGE